VHLAARGAAIGGASRRQRSDGQRHVSDPMAVAAESHLGVATVDGRDGDRGRPRKRRQYWSKHERMTMKIDEKKSIQSIEEIVVLATLVHRGKTPSRF
jgi:hypothetical protein